eukprot:ANDGO_06883.mRNA.1 hypothetical protein
MQRPHDPSVLCQFLSNVVSRHVIRNLERILIQHHPFDPRQNEIASMFSDGVVESMFSSVSNPKRSKEHQNGNTHSIAGRLLQAKPVQIKYRFLWNEPLLDTPFGPAVNISLARAMEELYSTTTIGHEGENAAVFWKAIVEGTSEWKHLAFTPVINRISYDRDLYEIKFETPRFFRNDEIRQYWDGFVENDDFDAEHILEEELSEYEVHSRKKSNRHRLQQTREKPTPVADIESQDDSIVILVNPAPVMKSRNRNTNWETAVSAPQNALTEFAFRGNDVFAHLDQPYSDQSLSGDIGVYGSPSGNPEIGKRFLWQRRHCHYDLAFVELTLSVRLRTFLRDESKTRAPRVARKLEL